jgi:rod shape determining protein RodA
MSQFINKKHMKSFDYINFFFIITLSLCGLLFIFSATYNTEKMFSSFFIKQTLGVCSGVIIYFLCLLPDYRTIMRWGYTAYFAVIGLLIFTLIKGSIGMGGQRWINLVFFKFQPSELVKLLFPACMVNYLHLQKKRILYSFNIFIPVLIILLFSFILIQKQPDLGTALIVLFSGLLLCWIAGLNKKFFIYTAFFVCIMAPILWAYALHDYQKNRIIVFLGQGDHKKEAYQIEQAHIAIGSGGLWGKGLFNGTQNRLRFLPESRTDFIFAVLCEEWGLIGALIILCSYFIFFIHSFYSIKKIKDVYAQLFASGLLLHIIIATIINIGMVLGMLPIVGIPLPLMSYGLSNLWITYASFGIFQNLVMKCR